MFQLDPPPKTAWAAQFLTFDYLIEGYFDGNKEDYILHVGASEIQGLQLYSARFRPSGNLVAPARPNVPSALIFGVQLIAIIPRDEPSTAAARKKNSDLKYPVPAEAYIGPYLFRGTLLCPNKNVNSVAIYHGFTMQDAQIDCLLPGAQLVGLTAPYVVIRNNKYRQVILPLA
jgi:hypothetical protein